MILVRICAQMLLKAFAWYIAWSVVLVSPAGSAGNGSYGDNLTVAVAFGRFD